MRLLHQMFEVCSVNDKVETRISGKPEHLSYRAKNYYGPQILMELEDSSIQRQIYDMRKEKKTTEILALILRIYVSVNPIMRVYEKVVGPTRKSNYKPEFLLNAVRAVQSGKLSMRKASEQNGVPYTTLNDKLKNKYKNKIGGHTSLSSNEEKQLLEGVFCCAKCGFPLRNKDVRKNIVQTYLNREKIFLEWSGDCTRHDVMTYSKPHTGYSVFLGRSLVMSIVINIMEIILNMFFYRERQRKSRARRVVFQRRAVTMFSPYEQLPFDIPHYQPCDTLRTTRHSLHIAMHVILRRFSFGQYRTHRTNRTDRKKTIFPVINCYVTAFTTSYRTHRTNRTDRKKKIFAVIVITDRKKAIFAVIVINRVYRIALITGSEKVNRVHYIVSHSSDESHGSEKDNLSCNSYVTAFTTSYRTHRLSANPSTFLG
ncbi:hypothetical protein ANN_25105 [Periplaneta americana]|uniref:HTH psq-type domain-containing protein n=1 Tax=Periplaneta americana TaxID=6978 RepID=A0ABQ8S0R4_PERAM|nr:hypothetical protein ANN_25105 [Periplaneta americana]